MSIETLYDGLDATTLRQLLMTKSSEWSSESDNTKKTAIMEEIKSVKTYLATAVAEENKVKIETSLSLSESKTVSTEKQHAHREITTSLAAVPVFGPNNDVHLFVNKLTNLFDLYVKGRENEDKLEDTFVRNCKKLLCDSYLTQLINSTETIDTFDAYKTYMYRVHASKEHHFQKLNRLWQMEPKEKENFTDLASRLENQAHEVRLSILAKYQKSHTGATDIPSKDLFDLITGQILLTHIQSSKHRRIYQFMANDLHQAWTVKDVANRAMTIADRVKDEVDAGSFVVRSNVTEVNRSAGGNGNDTSTKNKKTVKSDDKKKRSKMTPDPNKDCWFYLDGLCKKGDKCPWKHDPAKKGTGRPEKREAASLVAQSFTSYPIVSSFQ